MRYKVKWRIADRGPLAPEEFDNIDAAKERVRQLLSEHQDAVVDVWNMDETWQVVSPAGVADWCKA